MHDKKLYIAKDNNGLFPGSKLVACIMVFSPEVNLLLASFI